MSKWLLSNLFSVKDQAEPYFAFKGTVNWMRALSILVNENDFSDGNLKSYYQNVQRRTINHKADMLAYEKLLMALHNITALKMFTLMKPKYDVVRSAVIAWYYSVYFTSQAMISASSGADPESHVKTAKVWYSDIIIKKLVIGPFGISLSSLVPQDVEVSISNMRDENKFNLNNEPKNATEAWGCVYSYLKGTADYKQCEIEEGMRKSIEFRQFNVNNFRTKIVRQLRDEKLRKENINFLSQAFRYRGKANYRDSIYLSYGDDNTNRIDQLVVDLENVARKYLRMVCFYVGRRVERQSWNDFRNDLTCESRVSIDLDLLII